MGTKSNALFGQIQLTYFENGCCATVTAVMGWASSHFVRLHCCHYDIVVDFNFVR